MKVSKALACICVCILSLSSLAEDRIYVVKDCLKYRIFEEDSNAVVASVAEGMHLPLSQDSTLVLPDSVTFEGRTYVVDGVGRYAFCNRIEIKHLLITETITHIDEGAFNGCANLESVYVSSSLDWLDAYAFRNCHRLREIKVDGSNERYDSRDDCNAVIDREYNSLVLGCQATRIPQGVTSIGDYAFVGQMGLSTLTIPEGVESLGIGAFEECTGLFHVSLPLSLKSIGSSTFYGCVSLEKVHIPDSVRYIGGQALAGCQRLRHIAVSCENETFDSRQDCNAIVRTNNSELVQGCGATQIVEGIKSIGENAFWESSLTEIHIPSTVTSIAPNAFGRCRFCTSIDVEPGNAVYDSHGDCNAIIETVTGKLVKGCGLTVIPKEVLEIGEYAFSGMCMPANFVVPDGVQTIGGSAFSGCNFYNVRLPKSLRVIGSCAFADCKLLNTVDADSPELYVGSDAFRFCYSLESVRLPSRVIFENNTVFEYSPFQKIYEEIYGKP